jgi:hypothetical protein
LDQAFNSCASSSLVVDPLFYGERHKPNAGASFTGFQAQTSLIDVFGATAIGLIRNLSEMMPLEFMKEQGVIGIRLLNRAVHPVFKKAADDCFPGMRVESDEKSVISAAYGVACFATESC